ncbi:MAG: tetratricopeptide repeat protein, partial [Candidatus Acidoferrales bacterium]
MERARAHVEAQQYDAALHIYCELAAKNPRDFEARIWVARLQSWQGNYGEAEQGYRRVLREAPGNLEAELGLVDVLSWQGR